MYAKYVYLNTSTIEQIHDDIFEIFCGETTPSNLSASCDTTNTEILTTYSTSPWVDYDDESTTERIMRMEINDDSGVYKYVGWHQDGVDDLGFAIMESWDTGTGTPTNEVVVSYDKEGLVVIPASGGTVHIYSSQYCTIIMHETVANLFGGTGRDPSYGSLGIFECSRDHPSLHTGAGGMPNWFLAPTAMIWGDGDATMTATFWKGRDETDTVQTPFTAEIDYPGRSTGQSTSNSYPAGGALGSSTALTEIGEPTAYSLEPLIVSGSFSQTTWDSSTYYGNVSSRCDIWMMPVGSEGCGDLVILDGAPYVVFKTGYTAATAGNQYGGKFIVPYG